jgi:hypothetical protein
MAINGTHMLFYTSQPEELRAMLRDVFGFKHVDAGGGWLIFGLPPSEIGVHPAEGPNWESGARHSISFMCDDIKKTIAALRAKGINVDQQTRDEGYGITTMMHLPGGCEVMLYEPRHAIAAEISASARGTNTMLRATARPTRPGSKARRKGQATTTKSRPRPRPRAKKAGRRR